MIYTLFSLSLLFFSSSHAITPARQPRPPQGNGTRLITYNTTTYRSPLLQAQGYVLEWINYGEDGQFVEWDKNGLTLVNIATAKYTTLVPTAAVPEDLREFWIKPDHSKVLFATNYTKQYRHSYFADYYIYDVASEKSMPLSTNQHGDIQYAQWNPVTESIAYVQNNNIFLWTANKTTQITGDGSSNMFNGVPDWVYEEEILSDRSALWFSPDGKYLSYLSFNETGVPTYTVPYYTCEQKTAPDYPCNLNIRYPKVGEINPTVAFNLLSLDYLNATSITTSDYSLQDLIIGDVAWLTDAHSNVLFRAFNRVQDYEKLIMIDLHENQALTIRERDGSDGWLDNKRAITYVGNVVRNSTNATYYVDLSDESGWYHIYLFPVGGGPGLALTSGEWEVDKILKVDRSRGLVYYTSTEHHSTERHIYSVSYQTLRKTPLVDPNVPAVWDASFSSGGHYYLLTYKGPDVPYTELWAVNTSQPLFTLADNIDLYDLLQTFKLPQTSYQELDHPSGYKLNAMLRLPANFSPNKTYPVLLTPYGGPGSQQVSKEMPSLGWLAYISSDPELEYITYTVDNRGTGYKGRKFRASVAKNLGDLEAQDQIWAAQQLAKNPWVDMNKIAIWGWSYGGYLSAKVVEANSGVISMAMITAATSDWRFYDSMYTERYMKTFAMNQAGFNQSAVRKVEGFKNIAGGFLIQHGTGDDNVHFQNTAVLVDLLVRGGVSPEKMQIQFFTDSDHNINYDDANNFLYKQLSMRLYDEKHRAVNGSTTHQWSKLLWPTSQLNRLIRSSKGEEKRSALPYAP